MATTTNFGWETPDDTDLVKDGAAAIRTALGGVDTSFVDLKGGTTGQVLSKASNTDLDFTWVAQDDSNAIQNAIVDAKGDLIAATAADTPARLAVGTNGQVLTADSTASTGIKWATPSSGALTLISTTDITASSSYSFNNVFTSTYTNYVITARMFGSAAGTQLWLRFRSSGTDFSGAGQSYGVAYMNGSGTFGSYAAGSGTEVYLMQIGNASVEPSTFSYTFFNPQTAFRKEIHGTWHSCYLGYGGFAWGQVNQTTAYDGFTLSAVSGTINGQISIYGVQK